MIRIPKKQPGFNGKYPARSFIIKWWVLNLRPPVTALWPIVHSHLEVSKSTGRISKGQIPKESLWHKNLAYIYILCLSQLFAYWIILRSRLPLRSTVAVRAMHGELIQASNLPTLGRLPLRMRSFNWRMFMVTSTMRQHKNVQKTQSWPWSLVIMTLSKWWSRWWLMKYLTWQIFCSFLVQNDGFMHLK